MNGCCSPKPWQQNLECSTYISLTYFYGQHHHKGLHSLNWHLWNHSSSSTAPVSPAIRHHQATLLTGKPPWDEQCWMPISVIRVGGTQTWPLWWQLLIQTNTPFHTLSHSVISSNDTICLSLFSSGAPQLTTNPWTTTLLSLVRSTYISKIIKRCNLPPLGKVNKVFACAGTNATLC